MSLIPYKYNVTNNSNILTIPAFPGAYIYNRGIDSSPTALPIPIYMSEPVATSFMNDKDYLILVLPGFKIVIYDTINFGFTSTAEYTVDNITGTDIKFVANKTGSYAGSSYKLYYGIQEIAQNTKTATPSISSGNAVLTTGVVYEGNSYTLYSYTTTGSSTFQYNDNPGTTTGISALILLVGGGGAGGQEATNNVGGGGGGGGLAFGSMTFAKGVTYTCTVGNGGQSNGAAGEDSSITNPSSQTLRVKGGGGGGAKFTAPTNGGSGGGACDATTYGTALTGTNDPGIGAAVTFQGFNGGQDLGSSNVAGGGGGAGGAGGNSNSNNANSGNGGVGFQWPVNGTFYAGGGGGGQQSNGPDPTTGGSTTADRRVGGGGGRANGSGTYVETQPGDGGTNTGGGGGGSFVTYISNSWFYKYLQPISSNLGKGGSGIIIIAVKTSDLNPYVYV
jgi:hypothetical protein